MAKLINNSWTSLKTHNALTHIYHMDGEVSIHTWIDVSKKLSKTAKIPKSGFHEIFRGIHVRKQFESGTILIQINQDNFPSVIWTAHARNRDSYLSHGWWGKHFIYPIFRVKCIIHTCLQINYTNLPIRTHFINLISNYNGQCLRFSQIFQIWIFLPHLNRCE
jgi:hypothetical protein